MGYFTTAAGYYSTALGYVSTAQPYAALVMGQYNVVAGTSDNWVSTDPVLVVGNGSGSSTRSNAFTLLKNGNLTIAGTLTENSDARFKLDVEPLGSVLPLLTGLRGVRYRWADPITAPEGPQIGLLAQEVQRDFPELVHADSEGKLSVAYGNFTAVLLTAIQEQQREIAALRERVAALEARLNERQ